MKGTSQVIRNGFVSWNVAKELRNTGSLVVLTWPWLWHFHPWDLHLPLLQQPKKHAEFSFVEVPTLESTSAVTVEWRASSENSKETHDSSFSSVSKQWYFSQRKPICLGHVQGIQFAEEHASNWTVHWVINQFSLGVTKFEPKHQSLRADCRVSTRTNRWQGVVSLRLQTPNMHPNVTRKTQDGEMSTSNLYKAVTPTGSDGWVVRRAPDQA